MDLKKTAVEWFYDKIKSHFVAEYGRCWIKVDSTQSKSINMCQ